MLSVIGNAIEHGFCIHLLITRQQPRKIDPINHVTIPRRNARDTVRVPDVGINLAFDVFELIQQVEF